MIKCLVGEKYRFRILYFKKKMKEDEEERKIRGFG